jgi:hypothetical protein
MLLALFGITNDGLNLFVNLLVLFLVVVWIALIAWTYLDARRRIRDPVLVACATGASFFPYVGTHTSASSRSERRSSASITSRSSRVRAVAFRSSARTCGVPTVAPGSRTPASRARSRSTRAGRSARTARRLSAGRCASRAGRPTSNAALRMPSAAPGGPPGRSGRRGKPPGANPRRRRAPRRNALPPHARPPRAPRPPAPSSARPGRDAPRRARPPRRRTRARTALVPPPRPDALNPPCIGSLPPSWQRVPEPWS